MSDSASALLVSGHESVVTLQPECRLLLIGAGDVARYVAEFATAADLIAARHQLRELRVTGGEHGRYSNDQAASPGDNGVSAVGL